MISNLHQNVTTADQLVALPDDGNRYELVDGVLHMMSPAGNEHGKIALAIGASLFGHVKKHKLGNAYAAETGFRIGMDPDTVRAPDAAYVSAERLAPLEPSLGYLPLAPDLVLEVISPSDVFSEVEEKASQWLTAGAKLVLVANPKDQTLRVYRSPDKIEILHKDEVFEAGDACDGWQLPVEEVFE